MNKNKKFYKHKLFEHTDDQDITWYEVVWFENYDTKDQEIKSKSFDHKQQAETFINLKMGIGLL